MIRDARRGDAEAIALVHVRTWQGAYAHVFPEERLAALSLEARSRAWQQWIDEPAPGSHRLVFEDEHGIRGFAYAGPAEDGSAAELYAIYVLPEAWGAGHGRALMHAILERLRADGHPEAILWVLEDNPRTRRFYEQAGWRLDSEPRQETVLETPVSLVRYRFAL